MQARRFPMVRWSDRAGTYEARAEKRLVIGASMAGDVVIRDATVSRVHAVLEPREAGLYVQDLDSKNGTFIDGTRVRNGIMQSSGEVRCGTTVLRIDFEAGTSAPVELWPSDRFHFLVGRSAVMRELFALLARAANSEASVLIHGETGTGKEVVARSVHEASRRSAGRYVVVDCAALPENLLDAELFGHTKGAFTGAVSARTGAIESADGGTVFLDEIGELPMSMQPKLLRVIEQRTVRRIGEATHRSVDVRFVTATHRNLIDMVSHGQFREDLYFRLCVIPVTVPALRDRREDIELLARHFLAGESLSDEFMRELTDLPWRGNVRELRNYIERARALGELQARPLSRRMEDEAATSRRPVPVARETAAPPPGSLPSLRNFDSEPAEATLATDAQLPSALPRLPAADRLPVELGAFPTAPAAAVSLPLPTDPTTMFEGSYKAFRERWVDQGERMYIAHMLERHDGNVAAIAKEADVDRTYIYRLMRRHKS